MDYTDNENEQSLTGPPIPKLERNNVHILHEENSTLSLVLPEGILNDTEDYEIPEAHEGNETNEAALRELFIFPEEVDNWVFADHSYQLSRKELHQLSRGTLKCYGNLPPHLNL